MILKLLVVVAVSAALWLGTRYLRGLPFPPQRARGSRASSPPGPMTVSQAAAILGIAATSDQDTVRNAHRRLIAANHPDRGGSDYLAQQINQARDVLIQAEQDRR